MLPIVTHHTADTVYMFTFPQVMVYLAEVQLLQYQMVASWIKQLHSVQKIASVQVHIQPSAVKISEELVDAVSIYVLHARHTSK